MHKGHMTDCAGHHPIRTSKGENERSTIKATFDPIIKCGGKTECAHKQGSCVWKDCYAIGFALMRASKFLFAEDRAPGGDRHGGNVAERNERQ